MIRVLVAEDHAVVRSGLERLLATTSEIDVVGAAADGAEAVTLAAEVAPDVVLMDLSMPNMDGIEATRRILGENDAIQVVVLTSISDREKIEAALDAGAIGYLLKDAEPDEVIRGIPLRRAASLRSRPRPPAPCSPRAVSVPSRSSASASSRCSVASPRDCPTS